MISPQFLFLHPDGSKPSEALVALMRELGLPEVKTFAAAADAIGQAAWSVKSANATQLERALCQQKLGTLRPLFEELGVLRSWPAIKGLVRNDVTDAVWPAASANLCVARLLGGIEAINCGIFPCLRRIIGLAAERRKPVTDELKQFQDLGLDVNTILVAGSVLEGNLLREIWDKMQREFQLLQGRLFGVVSTNDVPPDALKGIPTSLATFKAWRVRYPEVTSCAIFTAPPYGYRVWDEVQHAIPDCEWILVADVPENPSVVGAISEVGKIVYNLNNRLKGE